MASLPRWLAIATAVVCGGPFPITQMACAHVSPAFQWVTCGSTLKIGTPHEDAQASYPSARSRVVALPASPLPAPGQPVYAACLCACRCCWPLVAAHMETAARLHSHEVRYGTNGQSSGQNSITVRHAPRACVSGTPPHAPPTPLWPFASVARPRARTPCTRAHVHTRTLEANLAPSAPSTTTGNVM